MASRMISCVKVLLSPICREQLTLPRRPPARVTSRGFSSVVTGFLEKGTKAELVSAWQMQVPSSQSSLPRSRHSLLQSDRPSLFQLGLTGRPDPRSKAKAHVLHALLLHLVSK